MITKIDSKFKAFRKSKILTDIINQRHLKDLFFPIILVCIAIATHAEWFNPNAIISHGDFTYWPVSHALEGWKSWGTWLSDGFGQVNIQLPFIFMISLWSLIANIGLNYQVSVQVTLFVPIAILGFLAPYYYLKNEFDSRVIAFVGALFYGSTAYFLIRQTAHLNICFVYAISPLVILALKRALETNSFYRWIIFFLSFYLAILYEIRISLLLGVIIAFYSFTRLKISKPKKVYNSILAAAIFFLLNIFWILPTIKGGAAANISQVANRGLFGNNLFDLAHALTITDSSWTGHAPNETFVMQPVPFHSWIFPVAALLSAFLVYKYKEMRKLWIPFWVLALIGVFLSKQSDGPVLNAYSFLYSNIPAFSLFREASKFYVLTAFAYMILIAISLKIIRKKYSIRYFATISLVLIFCSLINLTPLFTKDIQSTFISRTIPEADISISKIIEKYDGFARSLWIPSGGRWEEYSNDHPKIPISSLISGNWSNYSTDEGDSGLNTSARIYNFLKKPYAHDLLNDGSMRWIVTPTSDINSDNNVLTYFGKDNQLFFDLLKQIKWLTPVSTSAGNTSLYENKSAMPYITTEKNIYKLSNDTNYDDLYAFTRSNGVVSAPNTTNIPVKNSINTTQTFASISPKEIVSNGTIEHKLKAADRQLLYTYVPRELAYSISNGRINFEYTKPIQYNVNDSKLKSSEQLQPISYKIKDNTSYYVQHDSIIDKVEKRDVGRRLGVIKSDVILYEAGRSIGLESTQKGNASACSRYANNTISTKHLNGINIDSSSTTKPTCHSIQTKPLKAGTYLLEFKYKVKNTHGISYSIKSSTGRLDFRDLISVNDNEWHTVRKIISNVDNNAPYSLMFYAYSNDREGGKAYTSFNDITVSPVSIGATVVTPAESWTKTKLASNKLNSVKVYDASVDSKNVIVNPSFEQGTWQKSVGDCFNVDNDPAIGMSLRKYSGRGSVLELSARRHTACTSQSNLPVKENSTYLFSMDAKSNSTDKIGYALSFDDPDHTVISDKPLINADGWVEIRKNIQVPSRAKEVNIILYAYSEEAGIKNNVNLYDNLSLRQIPPASAYVFNTNELKTTTTDNAATYEIISPTKKTVHINNVSQDFILRMSENYNSGWKVLSGNTNSYRPVDAGVIPDDQHFVLNGFENGWYVNLNDICKNKDICKKNISGSYNLDLVIQYTPQRWLYIGLGISGTTLLCLIPYLIRRQKDNKTTISSHPPNGHLKRMKIQNRVDLNINSQITRQPNPKKIKSDNTTFRAPRIR